MNYCTAASVRWRGEGGYGVAGLAFGGGRIRILGGHRAFPWHRHDRGRRAVIDPMFINVILQRLAHRLTTRAAAGPDVVRLSFSPEMSRHMPPFRLSVHSSRPVQAGIHDFIGRTKGSRGWPARGLRRGMLRRR
jgi:hypothetical protein